MSLYPSLDHPEIELSGILLGSYPERGAVEVFQGSAFIEHAYGVGIPVEMIHPGLKVQAEAFTTMHEIVSQRRLKIPATLEFNVLREEMASFECDMMGISPRFGARGKGKGGRDDSVYSTAWGLHAGRCLSRWSGGSL